MQLHITSPPEPREEAAIKLIFTVPDVVAPFQRLAAPNLADGRRRDELGRHDAFRSALARLGDHRIQAWSGLRQALQIGDDAAGEEAG